MTGADLAGVDVVVAEVRIAHAPVLEPDEAVLVDHVGVELDLDLGVDRDGQQRGREVVLEQALGLVDGVDVGVEAVALVGELFHEHVVEAAEADTDGDEVDALVGVVAQLAGQPVGIGQTPVGDAVRQQDDPVDALGVVGPVGLFVAEAEPGLDVGAALGLETPDGSHDVVLVAGLGGFEHQAGVVAEGDDRDRVVVVELVDQFDERALDQLETVIGVHRTRHVDHERQRCPGPVVVVDTQTLHPDPDDDVVVVEGRRCAVDGETERIVGLVVAVVEGVHVLLGAHRLGRRALAVAQPLAGHAERSGVDIECEGRQGIVVGVDERPDAVVGEVAVDLAARTGRLDVGIGEAPIGVAEALRRRLPIG